MDFEQSKLDAIAEACNLPKLSFLREPEKGISTKNVIVSAEDGKEYFIKRFKKTDSDKIENAEMAAGFISENSDVPVVLPLENDEGQLHFAIGDYKYAVFPYIANTETRPESEAERIIYTKNLGEMLGKIHFASKNRAMPEKMRSIANWEPDERASSLARYEKISAFLSEKKELDEYDKKAIEFIQLKTALLQKSQFVAREDQPRVVCHGDYHGRNILFDEQWKIIGVCDWDISGLGNPYGEFIRSFNMCVIRRDFEHLDEKRIFAKAFFEGYASQCGFDFNVTELDYALEAWYEKLLTSDWPLSDHYYSNHKKTDPSLYSEFEKVIFLRDRRKELSELVASCL